MEFADAASQSTSQSLPGRWVHWSDAAFADSCRTDCAANLHFASLPQAVSPFDDSTKHILDMSSKEPSEQVRLMRLIYSAAERTIVWLNGEANKRSRAAMDFLATLASRSSPAEYVANMLRNPGYETTVGIHHGVDELLSRPYWRRLWIIQQIMCARDVLVQCGSHTASMGILGEVGKITFKAIRMLEEGNPDVLSLVNAAGRCMISGPSSFLYFPGDGDAGRRDFLRFSFFTGGQNDQIPRINSLRCWASLLWHPAHTPDWLSTTGCLWLTSTVVPLKPSSRKHAKAPPPRFLSPPASNFNVASPTRCII